MCIRDRIGELSAFAQEYVDAIAASLGCGVCVCDRDQIIAVAGISKKDLLGKSLHRELEDAINDREAILARKGEKKFKDFINYDKVEEYRNFGGIRNEEDYLITETGARRLGKKIPLTPEEVEALR